jgi:hypothetical protein
MMSCFLIVLLFLQCTLYMSATPLEDHYETEIDLREPRSLKSWEMHSVRQSVFKTMIYHNADNKIDSTI